MLPTEVSPNAHVKMGKNIRNIGIGFLVLGGFAILAPAIATFVFEQLIGWLLLLWGVAGVVFAWSFKEFSRWWIAALGFAFVTLTGLAFVLLPGLGAALMTAMLIGVFLLEGAFSIVLAFRLRGQLTSWTWMMFSGACSFVFGLIILVLWPAAAQWILGFLVGLNFLTTGLSIILLARAAGTAARR